MVDTAQERYKEFVRYRLPFRSFSGNDLVTSKGIISEEFPFKDGKEQIILPGDGQGGYGLIEGVFGPLTFHFRGNSSKHPPSGEMWRMADAFAAVSKDEGTYIEARYFLMQGKRPFPYLQKDVVELRGLFVSPKNLTIYTLWPSRTLLDRLVTLKKLRIPPANRSLNQRE